MLTAIEDKKMSMNISRFGVGGNSACKSINRNSKQYQAAANEFLDGVTRESVESTLMKSSNTLVKKPPLGSSLDMKI